MRSIEKSSYGIFGDLLEKTDVSGEKITKPTDIFERK